MLERFFPAAPLAAHVEMLWYAAREALPHRRERSLPTGCVDIVIPLRQDALLRYEGLAAPLPRLLRGAVVSGAHDRFAIRGTGGASEVIGVHFKPGGAAAFFGGGALGALRNRSELLEDLWGPAAPLLRARLQAAPGVGQKLRLLEQALLARLRAAPPADALVGWALQALAADPAAARVAALQRAAGVSPSRFTRRFEAVVGLTPKRHARVLRLNALLPRLVRVGPRDWAQVALEGGYFDQSHLIHEFNALAGVTPARYAPVAADQPTHVPIVEAPRR